MAGGGRGWGWGVSPVLVKESLRAPSLFCKFAVDFLTVQCYKSNSGIVQCHYDNHFS